MVSLRNLIRKAVFYNAQNHRRMVPEQIIVELSVQGHEEAAIVESLTTHVENGGFIELDDHYARPTQPNAGELHFQTHRGDKSVS